MKYFLFTVILGAMIGCFPDVDYDVPRRVDINLQIKNVGETLTGGEDSLTISEFKFLVRNFKLIAEDSVIIESTADLGSLVFAYSDILIGDRLILSVSFGVTGHDLFKGYHKYINVPTEQDKLFDGDFSGDPEGFSVVAKGQYNNKTFDTRWSESFDVYFEFEDEVILSNEKETLIIRTLLDIEDVFRNPLSGELLDPTDESDQNLILTLFQENIYVEATAAKMIF